MRSTSLLFTGVVFVLSGCNVDLILPRDDPPQDGEIRVIDLNDRTQNRAIINGQEVGSQ